jgi:uncharacterized membrane protein YgcG
MGPEAPEVSIAHLRAAWEGEVRPPARRALVALTLAALFASAHLARVGSPLARGGAAAALLAVLGGLVARAVVLRRRRADPRRVVRDTMGKLDPALAAATLRALTLVERTNAADDVGSPALASLHLRRLLARAPEDRIAWRASEAGARWARAGLALAVAAALAALVEPLRIVEGLDVLAARDDEAPLALAWIDEVRMTSAPPEYLHQTASEIEPFAAASAPRGATLTVHGRPLHARRNLVLTNGAQQVPFLDDGAGGVVARWTLGDTTSLRVAAVFGAVRIRQADQQPVTSIPDALPKVDVEGAPRTARLLDEPSISIRYEATDDHGLREVDLVLRAGTREERRVLSRPSADARTDRGGYELKANDVFFKRTYTPVEVTVEARDNDAVSGPKWGKSASTILVPPQVGEPEALRYEALLKARDAVTDLAAFRLTETREAPRPGGATLLPAKEHLTREADAQSAAAKAVEAALTGTYGGLAVRGRLVPLMRGQLRRLARALDEERKGPSAERHQKLLEETEDALLAIDVSVRAVGIRDARAVAKRLADVADEAADAASAGRDAESATAPLAAGATNPTPSAPTPAAASGAPPGAGKLLGAGASSSTATSTTARLDAATHVLDGGGADLLRLGELGRDLGEIVKNDLRRIARARQAEDLYHASLAARDLAARLRRPEPSFGGGGSSSGGGGGGVESGGSPSPDEGEPSSADDEAAQASRELEDLARDHEAQLDEVESALEKAASPEELQALKDEAKKHAEAVREAVKSLPPQGGEPGSAEGAAAMGRAEAESMASALEQGKLREALEQGKQASQSLGDARRIGEQSRGFFPEERAGREAGSARETVQRELAWAEDAIEKLRKASAERAKGDLSRSSKGEQRLADRARDLGKKGEQGSRSLPQEMLDRLGDAERSMRDAEKALDEGDGERGLRHQRDAQRLLEMTRDQHAEERDRESDSEGQKDPAGKADIPGKGNGKTANDFRRRVLEGLSGSSDPVLREAVKRYAEGLLK